MRLDRNLDAAVAAHMERHSQLMAAADRLAREGHVSIPHGATLLVVAAVKHKCDSAIAESQAQFAIRRAQHSAAQTSARTGRVPL